MTAKSNAREGDGVAVTDEMVRVAQAAYTRHQFDANPEYGPPSGLLRPGADGMRAALEAAMQAQQGAEQVIALLVAGGYVTADKVAEARSIVVTANGAHTHAAKHVDGVLVDDCAICGLDLRNKVHHAAPATGAPR